MLLEYLWQRAIQSLLVTSPVPDSFSNSDKLSTLPRGGTHPITHHSETSEMNFEHHNPHEGGHTLPSSFTISTNPNAAQHSQMHHHRGFLSLLYLGLRPLILGAFSPNDDPPIIRARSKDAPKLGMRPRDLPHGPLMPGKSGQRGRSVTGTHGEHLDQPIG